MAMVYIGLVFFTLTGILGVLLLAGSVPVAHSLVQLGLGLLLTGGSLMLVWMAVWSLVRDWKLDRLQAAHQPKRLDGPSPEIRALQQELLDALEHADTQLEAFETGGDVAAAEVAERCYRKAITASRKISGGQQHDHDAAMALSLAYLLALRGRQTESRRLLREVVAFYEQAAIDTRDNGHFWHDWHQARHACDDLAQQLRAAGDDDGADALEEQGRIWVETLVRRNNFLPASNRHRRT